MICKITFYACDMLEELVLDTAYEFEDYYSLFGKISKIVLAF